jgi:hypothetical protein
MGFFMNIPYGRKRWNKLAAQNVGEMQSGLRIIAHTTDFLPACRIHEPSEFSTRIAKWL